MPSTTCQQPCLSPQLAPTYHSPPLSPARHSPSPSTPLMRLFPPASTCRHLLVFPAAEGEPLPVEAAARRGRSEVPPDHTSPIFIIINEHVLASCGAHQVLRSLLAVFSPIHFLLLTSSTRLDPPAFFFLLLHSVLIFYVFCISSACHWAAFPSVCRRVYFSFPPGGVFFSIWLACEDNGRSTCLLFTLHISPVLFVPSPLFLIT